MSFKNCVIKSYFTISLFGIFSSFLGINAKNGQCIFCTTHYMGKDPVVDLVDEFTKEESLTYVKKMGETDDCMKAIIPSIRCQVNEFETEDIFLHPSRVNLKGLKKWFTEEKSRLSKRTPMMRNVTNLRYAVAEVTPFVLAFSDAVVYEYVDSIFAAVKDDWPLFHFMIVDASVDGIEEKLEEILGRPVPQQSFVIRQHRKNDFIVGSLHALTKEKLQSLLRITGVPDTKLLTARQLFDQSSSIKKRTINRPTLIYLFMSWHPELGYDLHMMNETVATLRQFGLSFDLQYFSIDTHIDDFRHEHEAAFINAPHLILFAYGKEKVSFTLNTIGPTDLMNTLRQKTFAFSSSPAFSGVLSKLDSWLASREVDTSHVDEGPNGCRCGNASQHSIDVNELDSQVAPQITPPIADVGKKKAGKQGPMLYGIPLVDKNTWLSLIKSTVVASPFHQGKSSVSFVNKIEVNVVIYTIDPGCSHCGNSGPVFHQLWEAFRNMEQTFGKAVAESVNTERSSVHVYNCRDDMEFCSKEVGSAGFPAVVAFRRLLVRETSHCTEGSKERPSVVRMAYHGVIWTEDLLDWLSRDVLALSMQQMAQHQALPPTADGRGALLVDVLPPWSMKIPRSRIRKVHHFYCMDCAQYVCERLMGHAQCYVRLDASGSEEMGSEANIAIRSNFVVTRVRLVRADNVSIDIMRIQTPLESTVNEKGSIHNFHKPHRYHLSAKQTCEDDHGKCTSLLIQFTKDHSRLPVMKLSDDFIHRDDTFLSSGMPILVALAYSSNLTHANASFKEMLQVVGRQLYDQIIVVTLNVDENNDWANRFVPPDYHLKVLDSNQVPPLYHYPRFCIINWADHNHAAFYPKVDIGYKTNYTVEEVVGFVRKFQASPQQLLQPSEIF